MWSSNTARRERYKKCAGSWGALALLVVTVSGCGENTGAYAVRIETPTQLIGGPGALATVGDYLIGNQHLKVVIQDQGWSRGFGVFGGGIIDADLERAGNAGGNDNFGEMFPSLFLQAFDVADQTERDADRGCTRDSECADSFSCEQGSCERTVAGIEVIADGSEGGSAVVRTRATGGDFFTMLSLLLDIAIPTGALRFETDYTVHPGARHVEITGRLINTGSFPISLSGDALTILLGQLGFDDLQLPLGDVILFGEGNRVFAPGAIKIPEREEAGPIGFNVQYSVGDAYRIPRRLPAFAGLVTDLLASSGPRVSYGFAVAPSERNYVWSNREQYELNPQAEVTRSSMLVPFATRSFSGAFYELPPDTLEAGQVFEYTKYFLVGGGDVASIRDELYKIRGQATGRLQGRIRDEAGRRAADRQLHLFDSQRRAYSQIKVDETGGFRCRLQPGQYYYVITGVGQVSIPEGGERFSEATRFQIGAGESTYLDLTVPLPAQLVVNATDPEGRGVPAKVTVVAPYEVPELCAACVGECERYCAPRNFLFDLALGEERRATDLNWRNEPGFRNGEFVETVFVGTPSGAQGSVRPSCKPDGTCLPYDVYVSRGPEYTVAIHRGLNLASGEIKRLDAELRRVVDTSQYVAADLHVHSVGSVDSFESLKDRVLGAAAEGIEVLVSTDHNYLVDYGPTIAGLGYESWVTSMVGVELSTLEMGHFNGFPLRYDRSVPSHFPYVDTCFDETKVNRSAFDWVQCAPQALFDSLRTLRAPEVDRPVVQVNHPRDSMTGYFNQYFLNPYTADPEEPDPRNDPLTQFIRPQNPATGQFLPERFSFDFDAIEVLNGKGLERLHAFRLPEDAPEEIVMASQDYLCADGHPDNGPGRPLLRPGGHVAFPGVVDDWMNLLGRCSPVVDPRFLSCPAATGNSDSHQLRAEIGTPRSYLRIAADSSGKARDRFPSQLGLREITAAIHNRQVLVTNGPFLTLSVLTPAADDPARTVVWETGDLVPFASSNVGREVDVLLHLKSAPWVEVDRLVVYGNGSIIDTIEIPDALTSSGRDVDDDTLFRRTYSFERDVVLVAEALGDQSLFPMVTPREVVSADVGSALGGILGSDSVLANADLARPDPIHRVTPYALTNPIWLDIDAEDGYVPFPRFQGPGAAPMERLCGTAACGSGQICDTSEVPPRCICEVTPSLSARAEEKSFPVWGRWDVRRVIGAHAHSH